jgi:hypothetical protein
MLPTTVPVYSTAWRERGHPDAIKWEVVSIPPTVALKLPFERGESGQGVWICVEGEIETAGQRSSQLLLWIETSPCEVLLNVSSSDGRLHIYNVWRDHKAVNGAGSQAYSSGMLREVTDSGTRYRCNAIGFDEPFQHLTFHLRTEA